MGIWAEDKIERAQEVGPVEDAHALLRVVYSNPNVPLHQRMKAAVEALPFERPKLAVSAVLSGQDFGHLLDQRIRRAKMIEAGSRLKTIEAKVVEGVQAQVVASELDL